MTPASIRALRDAATAGPWASETVRTSCGVCHRIGPFPAPVWHGKAEGWACVYDDYPPGAGSPHLIANAALIAAAPDLATLAADAMEECERMKLFLASDVARLVGFMSGIADGICHADDLPKVQEAMRREIARYDAARAALTPKEAK